MAKASVKDLLELLKTDFRGGTLVQYVSEYDFKTESDRATITNVTVEGNRFILDATGNTGLFLEDYKDMKVRKVNGVFYVHIPGLWNYALASRGASIPKRK